MIARPLHFPFHSLQVSDTRRSADETEYHGTMADILFKLSYAVDPSQVEVLVANRMRKKGRGWGVTSVMLTRQSGHNPLLSSVPLSRVVTLQRLVCM